jgi:hypothetical protein
MERKSGRTSSVDETAARFDADIQALPFRNTPWRRA